MQARTADLRASELRFRQMAENIRDVFFLATRTASACCTSARPTRRSGAAAARACTRTRHRGPRRSIRTTGRSTQEKIRAGPAGGNVRVRVPRSCARTARSAGSRRSGFPVRDDAGKIVRIAGVAEDITERKAAEDRITHLNRVYAVLSGINTLIVRVRDRDELFREACRIAVEDGGFRMAWIGIVDRSAMKIVPVASAGGDAGLPRAHADDRLSSSRRRPSSAMVARAVAREEADRRPTMSRHDPRVLLRRRGTPSAASARWPCCR